MIKSLLSVFIKDEIARIPAPMAKGWAEISVDTYWTRHEIVEGTSINDMARRLRKKNRNVDIDCIGIYTGPKRAGQVPDHSDNPFMRGYRGNPGFVQYFGGAKPVTN